MVHLICLRKEIFSGLSVLVEMEKKKIEWNFEGQKKTAETNARYRALD